MPSLACPKMTRLLVAVVVEELEQALRRCRAARDRHDDVFQQRVGAGRAGAGDRRVEALADVPERRALGGVGGQAERRGELEGDRAGPAVAALLGKLLAVSGPGTRRAAPRGPRRRARAAPARCRESRCATRSEAASSSSIGGEPGADEGRQRGGRGLQRRETSSPVATCGEQLDGAERRLGDEGERAFAADDEVLEDVDRAVVVEEGVERRSPWCSSSRTAGAMVATDPASARTRSRSASRPCVQLRLRVAQPVVGVGSAGVDDGAAGQDEDDRLERAVGVDSVPQAMPLELLATTPPMVQAISLAGSGPEFAP